MHSYVTVETERNIKLDKTKHIESQLKDDDLKGWDDIKIRIKQHLPPEVGVISDMRFVCLSCYWLDISLFKSLTLNMGTGFYLQHSLSVSPISTQPNVVYVYES